jgi:hypothetical protein
VVLEFLQLPLLVAALVVRIHVICAVVVSLFIIQQTQEMVVLEVAQECLQVVVVAKLLEMVFLVKDIEAEIKFIPVVMEQPQVAAVLVLLAEMDLIVLGLV